MKTTSFLPQDCICSAKDAQEIFIQRNGKRLNFKPFIINFHKDDYFISSICWKAENSEESNKEIVISALRVPADILNEFSKTEYIPLNLGDTLILNGRILTVEEHDGEIMLMQLPFVYSEECAKSIGNTLTGNDTSDFYWHLVDGIKNNKHLCYVWIGLCIRNPKKSLILPVFADEKHLISELDDMNPIPISTSLVINNGVYNYYPDCDKLVLEFICSTPQGLPS